MKSLIGEGRPDPLPAEPGLATAHLALRWMFEMGRAERYRARIVIDTLVIYGGEYTVARQFLG